MNVKISAKPDGSVNAYFVHYSRWEGIDIAPEFRLITDWDDGTAKLDLNPGEYVFSIMIEGTDCSIKFDCTQGEASTQPKITTPRAGKWPLTFKVPKRELRRLFHVYCIIGET